MPFYQKYWEQRVQNDQENTNEFRTFLNDNFSPIKCIFSYKRKTPLIALSYSMSKYGRGLSDSDHLKAAVKSPNSAEDYDYSYFSSFHEMTHNITDSLIEGPTSAIDTNHEMIETLAILFDYYLLKDRYPKKVDDYLKYTAKISGNTDKKFSKKEFLKQFPLSDDLKNKMLQLLQKVKES